MITPHERDPLTTLDYRGARYYDSDIARFLSVDPLAAQFPEWSAYNYVFGNPIIWIDPTGRGPEDPEEDTMWGKKHLQLAEAFGSPLTGGMSLIADKIGIEKHLGGGNKSGGSEQKVDKKRDYIGEIPKDPRWDKIDYESELGPIGLGISFEIGFPFESSIGYGIGYSFGFVADTKGLSWYSNKKEARGPSLIFSIAPEAFHIKGINTNIYNNDLIGNMYSTSVGAGPYGAEIGSNTLINRKASYKMYGFSGFGKGLDLGYSNWINKTNISPIFYPKK